MKKLLLLYGLAIGAHAQLSSNGFTYLNTAASLPASCTGYQTWQIVGVPTLLGTIYTCQGGVPTIVGGGGGSGTVTSVTFTGDGTILSSTPSSAVTTSGTVTATLANTPTGTGGVVLAASPALTGTPTAPTAAVGTNTTQLATMAAVQAAPKAIFWGFCTGVATAGANTLSFQGLGGNSTTCTTANTTGRGAPMPAAGSATALSVRCQETGVSTSSGVFTLWDTPNASSTNAATALTLTYGTTTAGTVVQSTGSVNFAAGDILNIKYTTQASETLGDCVVSFEVTI